MAFKFNKSEVKKAVEESNGTFTGVARQLKVRSSLTAKKFVEKFPDILELFQEKQDAICDEAEDILLQNLHSHNEHIQARTAEFILKNMPRSRWAEEKGEDLQAQLVALLDRCMTNTSND